MNTVPSFQDQTGRLYVIATPIGNLEDITLRAIQTLKEVDLIFAEDTRHSAPLCARFDITAPLRSYHEHNEKERCEEALLALQEGQSIALISDAGTPRLSDPGHALVLAVTQAGYPVVPIPGASALLAALVAVPFQLAPFTFVGFLPTQKSALDKTLEPYRHLNHTLIFYEAPHRIHATLESLYQRLGPRKVVCARELTKRFETFYHGTLADDFSTLPRKGEYVIIVEGSSETPLTGDAALLDNIERLLALGEDPMSAIKMTAKAAGLKKGDVYALYQNHLVTTRSSVDE
jgi:16S rRNA (cytidine1402-2'-O)-methyltransferase